MTTNTCNSSRDYRLALFALVMLIFQATINWTLSATAFGAWKKSETSRALVSWNTVSV